MRVPIVTTVICSSCALALAGNSGLCDRIREEGALKPKDAKETVGPWAQGQYDEWKNSNPSGADKRFWSWFHHKWAPDMAESIIDCKLSKLCSPVSCRFVDDTQDPDDQFNAYWTLESVSNYHNMAFEIKEANEKAWLEVRGDLATLMEKFSDGKNIEQHKADHDQHWKIVSHIVITIALLASAIATVLTAGAAGESIAILGLVTVSKASVAVFGAQTGLIGSAAVAAISFGSDFMEGKDYVSKMSALLGKAQKKNQELVTDTFDQQMLSFLGGEYSSPNSSESSLAQLVETGRYVNTTTVYTPEQNKMLRNVWTASYISNIWNTERTYIVMADAKGGCASDKRGYRPLRVCLDEVPDYVFYVFTKTHIREGTPGSALIRGPLGYQSLEEFTGFTLEEVVRASYVYSRYHSYNVDGEAEQADMVDNFFSANQIKDGGIAHGLFNLPILYSPGGQAISAINTKRGRNFPCMAAALPWSRSNSESQISSLGSRSPKPWTGNDPDTMFQFLNVTGLYQSGDYWRTCERSRKRRGNHCKRDTSVNWTNKFPENQHKKATHPFKRCKYRKFKFVGCDRPNNNGYDANKPKQCKNGPKAFGDTKWKLPGDTTYEVGGVSIDELQGYAGDLLAEEAQEYDRDISDEAEEASEGYQSGWTDDEHGADLDEDSDLEEEEGTLPT
ncbi:hypothetical protein D6C95_04929 [Aureobasidium pullulans]|nr:hypothetical protein D6C95_04929 [Aureobasidium pullulans]